MVGHRMRALRAGTLFYAAFDTASCCPQVAPIAAQAMDGYMMFSQKLKVHVVKQADVHPELFKGAATNTLCTD